MTVCVEVWQLIYTVLTMASLYTRVHIAAHQSVLLADKVRTFNAYHLNSHC